MRTLGYAHDGAGRGNGDGERESGEASDACGSETASDDGGRESAA